MRKYTSCIVLVITLLAVCVKSSYGAESDVSASLRTSVATDAYDYRVNNLRKYLEKFNSPLSAYAQEFVDYADRNGLDYRLVPAITGVESTFGKAIPANSYNAYGWANGNYSFKSWPESIGVVSDTLRSEYIDKGAPSINKIARRYAPPSTTWAGKVKYFVSKIDTLPLTFDI